MSQLLSRILLAMLMLPLATVVYVLSVAASLHLFFGYGQPSASPFVVAGIVTWGFIAAYWVLLWREQVRWTSTRVAATLASCAAVLIPGVAVAGIVPALGGDAGFGTFLASVVTILLWIVATILIWRETTSERIERVRAMSDDAIACLNCGYNMTGLREPKCPECGGSFTLDELLRGQRSREAAELSR
jgi:hypothetical protein